MFYYLSGSVAVIEQNMAVLDCGGVGFACNTSVFKKLSKLHNFISIIPYLWKL